MLRTYFVEFIDVSKADHSLGTSASARELELIDFKYNTITRIIYLLRIHGGNILGKPLNRCRCERRLRLSRIELLYIQTILVYFHSVCRVENINGLLYPSYIYNENLTHRCRLILFHRCYRYAK